MYAVRDIATRHLVQVGAQFSIERILGAPPMEQITEKPLHLR
jgi:hypothetical protein